MKRSMQKIIDSIVTVFLGSLLGSFFFFAVQAKAEPPHKEYYSPRPHVDAKPQSDDLVTQTINIILAQGFSGAIIVVLFGYIWREGKNNRAIHQENFDKFVAISGECSGHMAEVSSKLDGIERELEQTKTLELMKRS